ncbi:putative cation-transporting ATPase MJ1226 [Desulfovibrionales bacterium]
MMRLSIRLSNILDSTSWLPTLVMESTIQSQLFSSMPDLGGVIDLSQSSVESEALNVLFRRLGSSPKGLTTSHAHARLKRDGYNELPEARPQPLLTLVQRMWGSLPLAIQLAIVLLVLSGQWADALLCLMFLLVHAGIGLWEAQRTRTAADVLKSQLQPRARSLRNGVWRDLNARELVSGDVIKIWPGDIVPAEVVGVDGEVIILDMLVRDGRSQTLSVRPGETIPRGAVVISGALKALVTATGSRALVHGVVIHVSDRQRPAFTTGVARLGNGMVCLALGAGLFTLVLGVYRNVSLLPMAQLAVLMLVAGIPATLAATLAATQAAATLALSRLKALIVCPEAVERMACIDVLCTDIIGSLTQNHPKVVDVQPVAGVTADELLLGAALATRIEDRDPTDLAIVYKLPDPALLHRFRVEKYIIADLDSRRTEALGVELGGKGFRVTKGAAEAVLACCCMPDEEAKAVQKRIRENALLGRWTIAAAQADVEGPWRLLGLIALEDPLRSDAGFAVSQAREHGLEVKLLYADDPAIGRDVCRRLGLRERIVAMRRLSAPQEDDYISLEELLAPRVEPATGFSQLAPEQRPAILRALQKNHHWPAMTGKSVYDVPSLALADLGVAMNTATDAGRAVADLVMTMPGIEHIVRAILEGRRFFQHMQALVISRTAETWALLVTISLASAFFTFPPLSPALLVATILLTELPLLVIPADRTPASQHPCSWSDRISQAMVMALAALGVAKALLLLAVASSWLGLDPVHVRSILFMVLTLSGNIPYFLLCGGANRASGFSLSFSLVWGSLVAKIVAISMALKGIFMAALSWNLILIVITYTAVWIILERAVLQLVAWQFESDTPDLTQWLRQPWTWPDRSDRH